MADSHTQPLYSCLFVRAPESGRLCATRCEILNSVSLNSVSCRCSRSERDPVSCFSYLSPDSRREFHTRECNVSEKTNGGQLASKSHLSAGLMRGARLDLEPKWNSSSPPTIYISPCLTVSQKECTCTPWNIYDFSLAALRAEKGEKRRRHKFLPFSSSSLSPAFFCCGSPTLVCKFEGLTPDISLAEMWWLLLSVTPSLNPSFCS